MLFSRDFREAQPLANQYPGRKRLGSQREREAWIQRWTLKSNSRTVGRICSPTTQEGGLWPRAKAEGSF